MAAPTSSIIDPITSASVNVETNTRAARVAVRPLDHVLNGGGAYRMGTISGIMAAGTATSLGKLFAARWAPTNTALLAAIRKIEVSVGELTAFAAGFTSFQVFMERAYTAADATGATASTMTTNNGKLRTSYPTSAGMVFQTATTGLISGGTSTSDAQPFAVASGSVVATSGAPPWVLPITLFEAKPGDTPLVLANLEGFTVRAIFPATGTATLGYTVTWDEGSAF